MYCRYPSLIRELTLCLAHAIRAEPSRAALLLTTILDELESDQRLMESLFHEILERSRANDRILRDRLCQACRTADPTAIVNSFQHWESTGSELRELLQQVITLAHQGYLPGTDRDQEAPSND